MPQNKKTLSLAYGVSRKTLEVWLKPLRIKLGVYEGRAFTINQLKLIINHLGEPVRLNKELEEIVKNLRK